MAAYTDSLGFYKNSGGFNSNYTNRVSVIEIDLDFAKIAAARSAAGATALAAADTLVVGVIPKGALILSGAATLVRAEGGTATVDFAVSGSFSISNFDLNGTVGATSSSNTVGYMTADTNVVMTIDNNSTDAARVKLSIAVINMGADLGTIPSA